MNETHCSIIQIYILSISMHIQNLIEINKLIHKILRINKILMSIKGHNSVKNWPKALSIRNNMDLVLINVHTTFYQNSVICSEDIEEKHIFTSIKGHNSVVYKQIQPIWHPKSLLPDIDVIAKFEDNQSKTTQVKSLETTFLHQSRVITLLFINKFSPFAIPNHSSLISMSMQSLKKIGQKLLVLESGKRWPMDGRTNGRSNGSEYIT